MLLFEFDGWLLALTANGPAIVSLLKLPPRIRAPGWPAHLLHVDFPSAAPQGLQEALESRPRDAAREDLLRLGVGREVPNPQAELAAEQPRVLEEGLAEGARADQHDRLRVGE